ncbi:MAG TPA: rhomboid family intramembrane serine protease, partial [Firmicutes bacterium]|nr:rhomboid family intramembrane serine protease [Bacillota bacterium]
VKIINGSTSDDLLRNDELINIYPKLKDYTFKSTISELVSQMQAVSKEKALSIRKMISFQKHPYAISFFLFLIVVMFVFIQIQPDTNWATAIHFGAKYNPLIVAGDYWRLLTPAFVHLDVIHLLLNAVFIYQIGKLMEGYFGWWRTVIIILVSAVIGNLFSFAYVENISFGASTVAFGLIGAILFMCLENRKMFIHLIKGLILPILAFSFIWGIIDPSIDVFGHLGGFLGGFLIASILGSPKQQNYLSRSLLATGTIVFLVLGMFTRGTQLTERTDYESTNVALVAYYLKENKYQDAVNTINKLQVDISPYLKSE